VGACDWLCLGDLGMLDFAGKSVLITGGSSGIGLACVQAFAARGAAVIAADINTVPTELDLTAMSTRVSYAYIDVRQEGEWVQLAEEVVKRLGKLDILVNAAGTLLQASIENTTLEQFRRVQAVNVEGVFLGCQMAIRLMKTGGGVIVNMSSISSMRGVAKLAAYGASKAAVHSLTKSIALHCAERSYNIRCVSVQPSFIETPMVEREIAQSSDPARLRSVYERVSPMNRMGTPKEVASTVLFVSSDEATFINGAAIAVDGGALAR
jgi:3(or 17)beta-hydroxysteroid dehydrogenase